MAQPTNDEQRYGNEKLAEPGALFDPEVHGPIPFDGMAAYKAFHMGLPQSCTAIPLPRGRMIMFFGEYRGMGIPMWETGPLYAAISGTEAVVPIGRALTLVRDAFRTIWGYIGICGTDEPSQAQDLPYPCHRSRGGSERAPLSGQASDVEAPGVR